MGQGVEMEKESGRGHGIGALLSVPSNRISFVAHRLTGSNFITSSLSASSGLPSVRAQPHFPHPFSSFPSLSFRPLSGHVSALLFLFLCEQQAKCVRHCGKMFNLCIVTK